LAAAVVVAGLALAVLAVRPGPFRRALVRWFGPPQVVMAEAHGESAGGRLFDHADFDGLLAELVDGDGSVDYEGLNVRSAELDGYLERLAAAPFDSLGRDGKLALLINAYNAFTLKLILDHWPLDSIRDIPEGERWKARRWQLAGETLSLDELEHERIRPQFREPRIHFALVCAAVSCPPLRAEAYTAERLEKQLDDQALRTHAGERWYRYEPGARKVQLTPLYEWYRGDFEQAASSVLEFAARYDAGLAEALRAGKPPTEAFLEYDWALNSRRK
jgi:hypothetical protein